MARCGLGANADALEERRSRSRSPRAPSGGKRRGFMRRRRPRGAEPADDHPGTVLTDRERSILAAVAPG